MFGFLLSVATPSLRRHRSLGARICCHSVARKSTGDVKACFWQPQSMAWRTVASTKHATLTPPTSKTGHVSSPTSVLFDVATRQCSMLAISLSCFFLIPNRTNQIQQQHEKGKGWATTLWHKIYAGRHNVKYVLGRGPSSFLQEQTQLESW